MNYIAKGLLGLSFISIFSSVKKILMGKRQEIKKVKKSIEDENIRNEVFETLRWNPEVDTTEIGIVVDEGIVTLYGCVDNVRAQRIAEEVTEDIPGVIDVENQLRIKPKLKVNPNEIAGG